MKMVHQNRRGGITIFNRWRFVTHLALAAILLSFRWMVAAQQTHPETFVITISLSAPTIHVGEGPVITMITSNPTDHVVYAGQGRGGGPDVELMNDKGEDIGVHAMGGVRTNLDSEAVMGPFSEAIGPGRHTRDIWPLKPEPGYLVPGVYKLRIHRRDAKAGTDVYSNAVTFNVIP
jgi:hypothetical protein